MMDDDNQKRPLDPSDFEDDLYDDEFAFDENDPALGADLPPASTVGSAETTATETADFDALDATFEDTPENWGDFDDPALSAAKPGQTPGAKALPKKKSFVMKHFNTIVITLGVVLGAGVMGTQFMGSPSDPSSETMVVDGGEAVGDALPQPSPIAPVPEQQQAVAPEKLTPMPEAPQNLELAPLDPGPDLGLDNVAVKEGPSDGADIAQLESPSALAPIEPAVDVEKAPVELPDPIAFENQPIPTADPPSLEVPPEEAPLAAEPPAETAPLQLAENTPQPMEVPTDDVPAPLEIAEEPEPIAPEPVAAPLPQATQDPATPPAPQTAEELSKLNADNQALSERNKDLEDRISGANSKIEELASMLAEMEKKIAALETAPAPAEKPAPEAPAKKAEESAPAKEPEAAAAASETKGPENILVPAKPTKRPESVPEVKKQPAKAAPKIETGSSGETPRWILRSAQNGRAVVSDRSTGDLRSVEVGDTLRGIGQIKSIATVNGRWVVQGSQGTVKQ